MSNIVSIGWAKAFWIVSLLLAACSTVPDGAAEHAGSLSPPEASPVILSDVSTPAPSEGSDAVLIPQSTPYPSGQYIAIGTSVEGRPLMAWQFGAGPITIVLVGGLHGGYEYNGVVLVDTLAAHFRNNPANLLPGIRLIMIPAANPDGVQRGSAAAGRFNANNVDLNRNWGCGWEPVSYWQEQETSPGDRPYSEPETVALRSYFLALQPSAVVFYHSAGGAIYTGNCQGNSNSEWLGELLSESTGYPNPDRFDAYPVSGTADDWLDERGIPAATIELINASDPEFERNLAGLMALQCHFVLDRNATTDAKSLAQAAKICSN